MKFNFIRSFVYSLFLCVVATSCRQKIFVEDNFITVESLASFHMSTPDPKKFNPPQGQEVTINWSLHEEYYHYDQLKIMLTILFGNLEEIEIPISITRPISSYTYTLMNQNYFDADGILAYKVDLYADDQLIYAWKHQLWVDIIRFAEPCECSTPISNIEDNEEYENEDDALFEDD